MNYEQNKFLAEYNKELLDTLEIKMYGDIITKNRTGQSSFRKLLVDKYKNCIITGNDADSCHGCHIKPYAVCNEKEMMDINNGLLLDAGIHKLFDNYLITINPTNCRVEVNPKYRKNQYVQYHNKIINGLSKQTLKYLKRHYSLYLCTKDLK